MGSTPNLWLKQYIMFIKYNNPEAIKDGESDTSNVVETYLDQTPFF